MSESSLYFAFKTNSSKSLAQTRQIILMQKARELLISTDDSIGAISDRLNFSSEAYFRKCFKEHFGFSPREMRKKESFFS